MDLYIHREASFKKSLDALSRGDKTASQAALRAEDIIRRFASGDYHTVEIVNRRTKHGELRINGCRKFDLGGGYRLVCIKQGGHLAAAYVGSHDDCDRWIENNRGFECELPSHNSPLVTLESPVSTHPSNPEIETCEPDYDDILMEQIDEKILRSIFTGLCGEAS